MAHRSYDEGELDHQDERLMVFNDYNADGPEAADGDLDEALRNAGNGDASQPDLPDESQEA